MCGWGCSLPCGATVISAALRMALLGHDCVGWVPAERWFTAEDASLSPAVNQRVRHGGFMFGVDGFDHTFFAVSRAEAAAMDPQQRLLLETGYTALASAGLERSALQKGVTGVSVGIQAIDFALLEAARGSTSSVYAATGFQHAVASGRHGMFTGRTPG